MKAVYRAHSIYSEPRHIRIQRSTGRQYPPIPPGPLEQMMREIYLPGLIEEMFSPSPLMTYLKEKAR